jgi:hypothetical protein
VDLSTAADIAQVLGGLTVIGGAAFALVQLRHLRRQQRDAAAFVFIQQWDAGMMHHLDVVYTLPDSASPDVVARDPATQAAANAVYVRLEQLGVMVHERIVTLRAANDWAGGAVRVAWKKLRPWIEAKRRVSGSRRPGEWFQWLAERLAELPARDETVGAYEAFRSWRP